MSSDPAVATIDASGVLRGRMFGSVTVTAVYNEYQASQDVAVVEDFAGSWRGFYTIEKCARLTGGGSSYCRFVLLAALPFELSVVQSGRRISGSMRLYDSIGRLLLSGAIDGVSDSSATLHVTATVRSVAGSEQPEVTTITDWSSVLSVDKTAMTGQFVKNLSFTNAFGPQTSREECSIRSAVRLDP